MVQAIKTNGDAHEGSLRNKVAVGDNNATRLKFPWAKKMPENEKEREALVEFRKQITQLGIVIPFTMFYAGDEDATLLRFLRARKLDLSKALSMLQDTIKWRRSEGVDGILAEVIPEETLKVLYRHSRGSVRGFDLQGRPAYFDRPGYLDVPAIMAEGVSTDEFLRKHIQELEHSSQHGYFEASERMGRTVDQTIMFMDVSHVKLGNFTAVVRETFGRLMTIDQDNYPETNGASYILNSSWVFRSIFATVSIFLDPKTKQKVQVLAPGDQKALKAIMPLDHIPEFCGGTLKESALWNDEGMGEYHHDLIGEVQHRDRLHRSQGVSLEAACLPAWVREQGEKGALRLCTLEEAEAEGVASMPLPPDVLEYVKKTYMEKPASPEKVKESVPDIDEEVVQALKAADRVIAKCYELKKRKPMSRSISRSVSKNSSRN